MSDIRGGSGVGAELSEEGLNLRELLRKSSHEDEELALKVLRGEIPGGVLRGGGSKRVIIFPLQLLIYRLLGVFRRLRHRRRSSRRRAVESERRAAK